MQANCCAPVTTLHLDVLSSEATVHDLSHLGLDEPWTASDQDKTASL